MLFWAARGLAVRRCHEIRRLGRRFFDESEAQHSFTYAKTGRAVLAQPGSVAYQIYDQKGLRLFRYPHHSATFHEANTIEELARKIGIEPRVLVDTIDTYNAASREDIPFDPSRPDGKCTAGLDIPKSNWATRIDQPPYRAYPVTGGITFTFGGVQVTQNAQVLNTADQPVRGLYASGDILGLFFYNYPSFTGQTRNAVFSKLAGYAATHSNQ
jgi:tricarballylate dehydrogenase